MITTGGALRVAGQGLVGVLVALGVGAWVGLPVGPDVVPEVGSDEGSLDGVADGVTDGVGAGGPGVVVGEGRVVGAFTVGVRVCPARCEPVAAPRVVPLALEVPSRVESGLPRMPSSPVTDPRLSARTAAADRAIVFQRGRGCSAGAGGGATAAGPQRVAVLSIASRLRCREALYMELAMVAITLATAAPAIVPATPR
ncbi:MAG: hypothetical protein JWQ32_2744 [Marmoricola sp.]|nr:hypothetical protein [Marmoricola sp.]